MRGNFTYLFFYILKVHLLWSAGWSVGICVPWDAERSEDNFQESVPSIHHRSQGLNSSQQAPLPSESSLWPNREKEFKCFTQTSAHVCLAKPNTLGQRICQNPFLNFCSSLIIFKCFRCGET